MTGAGRAIGVAPVVPAEAAGVCEAPGWLAPPDGTGVITGLRTPTTRSRIASTDPSSPVVDTGTFSPSAVN